MTIRSFRLFAALALLPFALDAQGVAKPAAAATRAPVAQKAPPMAHVDSAFFQGLKYRLAGHSRGGRVTSVTGVPSQPRTFYMGVASGGVFRTTNGGESWEPITDGKMTVGSIGSIAVAESNPDIIYVGTGSDGVRSNVSTGRGVYRTDRRRQDLEVHGAVQRRPDRRGAHPSVQSGHRVGGGLRRHLQAEHRARRVQDHRRRQERGRRRCT